MHCGEMVWRLTSSREKAPSSAGTAAAAAAAGRPSPVAAANRRHSDCLVGYRNITARAWFLPSLTVHQIEVFKSSIQTQAAGLWLISSADCSCTPCAVTCHLRVREHEKFLGHYQQPKLQLHILELLHSLGH